MAKYETVRGQTGNIAFAFLPDTSSTTGGGKTALTNASAGLNIAVRREKSATFTAYSGANIGTITTLGTWASPGTGKCNFKEVDSTNAPGLYELHFEDAQFSTSDTSRKLVGMVQATGVAPTPFEVELTGADLQDGVRQGMTAIPNAAAGGANGLLLLDGTGTAITLTINGDLDGTVTGNVIGDVQGKLLGGGIGTPTAVGAWVANGSGNPVATAAAQTTLQNAVNALPSASTIATTVWGVLTSALTTAGSIGKLLATLLFDGSGNVKSAPQTQVVLASNGLDQIATTTSGAPSTWKFPQWIMWLVRRWVRTTYDSNAQTMVTKDAAGTTISTQTATNAAGVQTTGELS